MALVCFYESQDDLGLFVVVSSLVVQPWPCISLDGSFNFVEFRTFSRLIRPTNTFGPEIYRGEKIVCVNNIVQNMKCYNIFLASHKGILLCLSIGILIRNLSVMEVGVYLHNLAYCIREMSPNAHKTRLCVGSRARLDNMYSYCCLCILIVRPCILIVVNVRVFLLFVHIFLLLSMYSYCSSMYSYRCLCILIVVYVFLDTATLTEVFPYFFLGCKTNARV